MTIMHQSRIALLVLMALGVLELPAMADSSGSLTTCLDRRQNLGDLYGRERSMAAIRIRVLEPIARQLRASWPTVEGDHRSFGPFLAYPGGAPTTLLLLTARQHVASQAAFCSIERTAEGGLRFQMIEAASGTWMEWHPPGHRPCSFVSGLDERYLLIRSEVLPEGWYETCYAVD